MRRSYTCITIVLFSLIATACGGGSDSPVAATGESTESTSAEAFPASTRTGEDICFLINPQAVFTVLGVEPGTEEIPLPSDSEPTCHISTWNAETEVTNEVEFFVTIVNTGGQAGYDSEVARWAELSDVNNALPGIADQATYLEGPAGQRILMLSGDDVIQVSSGRLYVDLFNADSAADVATVISGSF